MPTVLYMHSESSCKLINPISPIARLNYQQIGFISWNTLAAALNYTAGCYFYTTVLLFFYYYSILL